jgi:TPP-dependent pyruvate/acetoin dehydrogenase alpha subunit
MFPITIKAKIRLVSQKPGDESSTYTTREENFEYDVTDPNQITPNEVQEKLIANALAHRELVAKGYTREDVAVLEFDAARMED